MPNWCECDVKITGKRDDVAGLMRLMATDRSPFDFNAILPYPDRFARLDEVRRQWERSAEEARKSGLDVVRTLGPMPQDGYNQGGYEWCYSTWGVKWPASDIAIVPLVAMNRDRARVTLSFQVPWSPPSPVMSALAARFPGIDIAMRCYERGQCFKTHEKWSGGTRQLATKAEYRGRRGG